MFEPKELVNMVATIGFSLYYYALYRKGHCNRIPTIWLFGILLIAVSDIATVAEGFVWPRPFDFAEHFSFMCACFCFFIGAIQLKPEENSGHP